MTTQDTTSSGSKGRKRGGPLRINRARIIDTARQFDPETMTMQAVADELGVDRKALNYHVSSRENLLRLVAEDVFESTFSDTFDEHFKLTDDPADWRGAIRSWAYAVRDSLVATGVLTNFYRIGSDNPAVFEPVETVLERLQAAGFDETTSGRALISVTHLAMSVGRDLVMENRLGEHPQAAVVEQPLSKTQDTDALKAFRGLASARLNDASDSHTQFEFELDVFIAGLELRLGT